MRHEDFTMGAEFTCGDQRWRCTDIGTRVIVAICLSEACVASFRNGCIETKVLSKDEAETEGWFNGPPYVVAETVFDEDDMEGCEPA
jgi:hypothetical protein